MRSVLVNPTVPYLCRCHAEPTMAIKMQMKSNCIKWQESAFSKLRLCRISGCSAVFAAERLRLGRLPLLIDCCNSND